MIYLSSLIIPLLALLPNLFFAAAGGARGRAGSAGGSTGSSGSGAEPYARGARARPGGSPTGPASSLIGAGGASGGEPLPLVLLERVGQVGVFLSPVLYPIQFDSVADTIALIGMAITLGIYYACWTRYFTHGSDRKLLVKSFLRIPIPMAIMPVLYFLCGAQLLRSPILVVAALVLAAGHIPITLMQRARAK